jgi:hypothetical protein
MTNKQDKALEILVESGGKIPVSKAMVQAGYSPATAKTPKKLTQSEAYKSLFPIEKTQEVIDNLHKLSISAESQDIQVKATKEWLDRAVPKTESNASLNFTQINNNLGSKYAD